MRPACVMSSQPRCYILATRPAPPQASLPGVPPGAERRGPAPSQPSTSRKDQSEPRGQGLMRLRAQAPWSARAGERWVLGAGFRRGLAGRQGRAPGSCGRGTGWGRFPSLLLKPRNGSVDGNGIEIQFPHGPKVRLRGREDAVRGSVCGHPAPRRPTCPFVGAGGGRCNMGLAMM